jgi:glycosyltransferase involved in cell wall biosynthesis
MKITFLIPWANLSGGVRVVTIYAQQLQKRGHSVLVLSLPRQKIPFRRKVKSLLLGRGWPRMLPEASYLHGSGVELRVLESLTPRNTEVPDADVIVATFWNTAHVVRQLPPAKGAKAIFIQNYEVMEGKSNPALDATWRMPMHKVTISKWLVDLARERFGDAVVSHVPNSVDFEQFNAPPRSKQPVPTVGLLYSRSWFKGCRTSLAALKQIKAALPSLRLISFGAERPVAGLRLPSCAEFHLQPPQQMLRELYAQCDVWLCGSNREGFHLPPLEAMACRCPVVSTNVGGPLDLIQEGVNGHLVEIGDAKALAQRALQVMALPPAQWIGMSEAAYRTATRYTWEEATDRFEQALFLAIERNNRGELREQSAATDIVQR